MTRKIIFIFLLIFYCAFLYAIETDKLKKQMCAIPGTNYQLSSTEVTQCLFEEVTGENPSANINPNYPVECVSYYDAIYFCNKLSVLLGFEPVYVIAGETDILKVYHPFYTLEINDKIVINENADGFRIPTIKEWQYAAKGGENYKYPGSDNIDDIAIVKPYDPEESHEYEAAQKKPNGYGLYDMSGNVSEWVMDLYEEELNYTCGACFASGYGEDFEIPSLGYGSRKFSRGDIGIRLLRANIKKVASSNLRLRTNEAKDNETICIMSKGSQIKILEFGSPETIDGISSNWVKVEVQKGAKDRDGNPIKAGTVGWCYGGYLK
ncbi:MAG: SUMF1/EgtB/PvdO family nonheme iron enzyme [Treponema sp.]|nr:SUMF1/EgtB/PvdO family nonheme iron enzyme [Treponema sp.]